MSAQVLVIGPAELGASLAPTLAKLRLKVKTHTPSADLFHRSGPGARLALLDADSVVGGISAKTAVFERLRESKTRFIVLSASQTLDGILEAKAAGASDYILKPYSIRELLMRLNAVLAGQTRIASIGGGTGLFTLLLGLKTVPNTMLTSIVNMSDDGGSSGKLSQTFGVLPPGDIRRSLVALSNAPEVMNQIIQYRFDRGGEFRDHSFGNLFLTVLADVKGSMSEAVRALSDILNIQGVVLPATRTRAALAAEFENGLVIQGESKIDLCEGRSAAVRIRRLWHEPEPAADPDAYASILNADFVTIGPGDLYTSVITNLAVPELREAVRKSRAKKIYVCNLMTKPGETFGFSAEDHVREIVRYLGEDCLDTVLISNTKVSDAAIREYSKKEQAPVIIKSMAELHRATKAKIIPADIGNETVLVRHDHFKLRHEIEKIIGKSQKR